MIVVGGEAVVDLVPDSAESTVDSLAPLVPRLGGGPCNTAVACGRLGVPTAFLSKVSTDPFGEALLNRLSESTVDTSFVQRGTEPTTLAVVTIDAARAASYAFYVEGTADRFVTDPGPLPGEVTVCSVGSFAMVLEPGASAYESVLRAADARGVCTVLDPNVRPGLITDPDAYRARFASWLPHVRVLKTSEDDVCWLGGVEPGAGAVRVAREWARRGPDAVVFTAGEQGIRVFTAAGEVAAAAAPRVPVADTIGAGDTVHAALLARLHGVTTAVSALDDAWWARTARFAAGAAAVTVSRPGADPPWAAEVADV